MLESKLMQKVGLATTKLAGKFFALEQDSRIPIIGELAHECETSNGTVQTALSILQEEKAIQLLSRGQLGTYITKVDPIKLLEIAGFKTMVGVMPLPYSKKYEGLATGLCAALEDSGLNATLAFMRGSDNRLRALQENRYDYAVLSQLTAQYYIARGENIEIVHNLGKFSYVSRHVLLLRENDPCYTSDNFNGYKIGIDRTSIDQKTMTDDFFEDKKVDYVPLIYSQIIPFLQQGKIDAAVWNLDDIDIERNHLCYRELDNRRLNIIDTEAAIVCMKDNEIAHNILQKMLNPEQVLQYQKEVLDGNLMPRY